MAMSIQQAATDLVGRLNRYNLTLTRYSIHGNAPVGESRRTPQDSLSRPMLEELERLRRDVEEAKHAFRLALSAKSRDRD